MVNLSTYTKVGNITKELADIKNFKYPGQVYAAPGVINHIREHHGEELSENISENLLETIRHILSNPDYVGCDPKKEGTSLELIKKIEGNILLGLKFDIKENYIFVASLYPVTESKIHNRIYGNRLVKL